MGADERGTAETVAPSSIVVVALVVVAELACCKDDDDDGSCDDDDDTADKSAACKADPAIEASNPAARTFPPGGNAIVFEEVVL